MPRATERRVALILPADRSHDLGDGIAIDALASAVAILRALAEAGYRVGDAPRDPAELMARLRAGPTNANPGVPAEEMFSFAGYSAFFATLPPSVQQAVAARWGGAESDPLFRPGRLDCGRFAIPGFRARNVAVLIEPACGHTIDSNSAYQNSAPAPPHSWLAAHAWLADDFRADAVIHLGKQPDDTPGPSAACILDHLTAPPVRAGVCGMIAELEQLIGGRR